MFKFYSIKFSLMLIIFAIAAANKMVEGTSRICPTNEFYSCGSACQTECATLNIPCPIVNIKCNEGCYCIEGYARNAYGKCIKIEYCD